MIAPVAAARTAGLCAAG